MSGSAPVGTPPPGWYPDGGPLRWWDGQAWGPWAPAQPGLPGPPETEEQRGRSMAIVSHLGFLAGGFILPLILYLVEKDKPNRNRFVCHHACEALNWSITFMAVWLGGIVVMWGGMIASIGLSNGNAVPWPFFVFFPLMFVFMGLNWVFGIMGMVRANQGRWWRYPVCLRLVGRGIDWQQVER